MKIVKYVPLPLAVIALLSADGSWGADPGRTPDILFVQTDYQRGVDGPSLGSPFLKMPTLDRLCREGAVFSRHISTSPICMPARFCWITGQYPHTHGQWDNWGRSWPEESPMLVELLQQFGYNTIGFGKMHFCPWDRMTGFDRRIIAEGQGNMAHDDFDKFLSAHGLGRRQLLQLKGKFGITGGQAVYDWRTRGHSTFAWSSSGAK